MKSSPSSPLSPPRRSGPLEYELASTNLSYLNDVGSGRCRLPIAVFNDLKLRLGSIVEIAASPDVNLLCSAWPDTSGVLQSNEICLDDAVYVGTRNPEEERISATGTCNLSVRAVAARISSSVHAAAASQKDGKVTLAMMLGLPICAQCTVMPRAALGRKDAILVSSVRPGDACLAGQGTIVVNAPRASVAQVTTALTEPPPACRIGVVTRLIESVVEPVRNVPQCLRCHGVLLLGPPGVGKTFAVQGVQRAVAGWCRVLIYELSVSSLIVADSPLASLEAVLASGRAAAVNLVEADPSAFVVVFFVLDEVDALGRPETHSDAQAAIKRQICQWLDEQSADGGKDHRFTCCLIATSNHASEVDSSLRRGGRFDCALDVVVTAEDRRVLLTALAAHALSSSWKVPRDAAAALAKQLSEPLALRTGGYVSADLVALTAEALKGGAETEGETQLLDSILDRFARAAKVVQPSSLRGATVSLPNLGYNDVVGHEETKRALRRVLAFCSSDPALQRRAALFGLSSAGGALLHGPPGNSKTRLIMAVAAAHALPVISLSSADVYSPYVGDAEAEIRRAFRLARQAAPCVLFLDELDALVTDRGIGSGGGGGGDGGVSVEARVLATLLTEMDGIDGKHGVVVLGATNRLQCIDAALLRKGRFHHLLCVPNPDPAAARLLLRYFSSRCPLVSEERARQLEEELREGMSGADIENLVREENMRQLRTKIIIAEVEKAK